MIDARSDRISAPHDLSSELEAGAVMVRLRSALVRSWLAAQVACRCGPDDPDQQLVTAHQADPGPCRDDRADWSVGPALGHVRGERRDDAEREQPAGQGQYREPVPLEYSIERLTCAVARCIRTQGSDVGFGADGTFPGPP